MNPQKPEPINGQSGFTLVELGVVLAIILILAAAAVAGFGVYLPRARTAATVKDGICLQSALQSFATSHPNVPAPSTLTNYAEVSGFGRENGCHLQAENEAGFRPRSWETLNMWCYVWFRGRLYIVPCPPWPTFPWGLAQVQEPQFSANAHIATGAELALRVRGVEPEDPGAVVLVSPSSVRTFSVTEYDRYRSELPTMF